MSAGILAHIADRVINAPLLIMPEKLAVIAAVLEGRIAIDASEYKAVQVKGVTVGASGYIGDFKPVDRENPKAGLKPYRTAEGVAIIPVIGSLVNRGGFFDAVSGVTTYERLRYQLRSAAADKEVGTILLDIDSGGGEAIGAFETGDAVRAASIVKPVYAVANGLCCSAAYAIASGASRIYATRSSLTGSIGTALLHLDRSKQLAGAGIKPTLFVTGKRKQEGHPFFELSDEVKGELSRYVHRVNQNFLVTVANHRRMPADAVRAQEAAVFIGVEGIRHSLVDEVGDFDEVIGDLRRKFPGPPPKPKYDRGYATESWPDWPQPKPFTPDWSKV